MHTYLKLSKTLLFIGGILEFIVASFHFTWPYAMIQTGPFAELPEANKAFIVLATLAIGLVMLVFGSLSIYFAFRIRMGEYSALVFSLAQAILWTGRLILEILYPVRLPLYFIEQPSSMVIVLSLALILIFTAPLVLYRKNKQLTQQFI